MVDALAKQLAPLGVVSAADYTEVKSAFPLGTVTVRVFVFADAEKCRAWWKKKYGYAGWEEHYKVVEIDGMVSVDSLQVNKRAIGCGKVWMTVHQTGTGEAHLKAGDHILRALTGGKRKLLGGE